MFNKMAAVLVVVALSFAAGNASAKMGGGKRGMACEGKCGEEKGMMMPGDGMAHRFMKMVAMLELAPEQKKAVETIHLAHRKDVIRKEADIDVAEIELKEIMGKEPVNLDEVENKVRAIANLRADLEIMHLKTKEAIKAQLTPEQLVKFKKHLAAEMMERMDDMGGKGHMDCADKEGCKMGGKMEGKMAHKMAEKIADKMEGKMEGKTKKCNMMGEAAGGMNDSDADATPPEAMAEKMKAEHSHHH